MFVENHTLCDVPHTTNHSTTDHENFLKHQAQSLASFSCLAIIQQLICRIFQKFIPCSITKKTEKDEYFHAIGTFTIELVRNIR